jgi:hypothetical protein
MANATRRILTGLAALVPALLSAAEPAGEVTLKTTTYAELGRTIRGLRGKVVVVDFWAIY